MTAWVLVAMAVTGASAVGGGAALARLGGPLPAGVLLALSGAALLGAVATGGAALLLELTGVVAAAALVAYPELPARRPEDRLAALLTTAAPLVLLLSGRWATGEVLGWWRGAVCGASALVLALHTWWRLERSSGPARSTLLWMALPVSVATLVLGVVTFVAPVTAGWVVLCLVLALLPWCLWAGAGRPQVLDVRGLVVATTVAVTTVAVYVALLESATSLVELGSGRPATPGATALLAALCAFGVAPARRVLREVLDAVLFGQRPDPLRAATRMVDSLGDDPASALAAVRESLVLPYAAVAVDGQVVAASGEPPTTQRALPLPLRDGRRGELLVGLRPGDLRMHPAEEDVLHLVAPLLAQTLRAQQEAAAVRSSREATVQAVEEERRRLRRDLHDELGPRLSGIAFTADAARNTLHHDPAGADALLGTVRAEAVAAIGEVRRLVYGMRPPALDELGLLRALRQHAATLRTADDRPLRVEFEVPGLPELPAAWEVAAYRIVAGALDNTARHSGTDAATVRMSCDGGRLLVEVADTGAAPTGWSPGVGVSSMRERSAELGGTLRAGPTPEGWLVRSEIPLPVG
ncbi:histidine kinase [Motilibacter rhizosphaerae]|uniref:histidine kinase n=1 Tax=Motilibacter rhizosphaerae TaxID=598652 RepID=A0A4Q7NV55_9ACTN|nr:histidine kinase [Motilibacter rhizosphaerae]RZS91113.1 histidine kinase [Motilibacter rhizosphaerae]